MKRSKRLIVLLCALCVACAATFGVLRYEEYKEKIQNSDQVILEISGDAVQSLSWEYEGEALSFHKGETWLYDGDEAFPVDEEKINERLELFQGFGVTFIIEDVEDYGQYGLDEPVCTITLKTEEETYEILLGDYSKMDSQRYVSIGDGNAYLVKEDPLDYFDAVLEDMIDHDETPTSSKVNSLQFSGTEDWSILYEEETSSSYRAEDVYFAQRDGEGLPLDSERMESYLQNLQYLSLTNYVTYNATQEELERYGLDAPELTITAEYPTETEEGEETTETFILHISRDPEERQAAEEAEDDEDDTITAYARVGESQIVYKLTSSQYTALMAASYDDLRHREVSPADFADVGQIDVTLEGKAYTITSEEEDGEKTWTYLEEELDIGGLQSAVDKLKADTFTDETPTQKEEIGFTLHLEREGSPAIHIQLYRYDGSHCLAVVDGEPFALVERSQVVDLIEAVNAIVLNG